MEDVYVTVVGGGVCGVLAAQRFGKEGLSYTIIEKGEDYGGVWAYRANDYSHLQAYAALYAWDLTYRLDENPFKKCPSTTVLSTLRTYATDYNLRNHTHFSSTVTTIQEQDGRYIVTYEDVKTGKLQTVRSKAVFVCSGILGKQLTVTDRSLPHIEAFTGLKMFAGKQEEAQNHLREGKAKGKDVVILGSGAFGLEAMEAAQRSGAKSITLVTRDRDRWIVPYSEQFRFIVLSHCPFLPRWARCKLMEAWLQSRYKTCGMEHMIPAVTTPQNFTGQCNDAFFQYAKEGKAKYIIGEVKSFKGKKVELKSGEGLHADILVTALGHELQKEPAFLSELGVGFTTDLHNFAFLGKNPYLGGASDWVWFNVPHGPQKQIDSFVSALLACKAGKETEVRANLVKTPFVGCKGEPLNCRFPSGMDERKMAYWRTRSAGLSWFKKAALSARLYSTEWQVWLLCAGMCIYESFSLGSWLKKTPKAKKA